MPVDEKIGRIFGKENIFKRDINGVASKDFLKCATPIMLEALANSDKVSQENRFIFYRPTDSGKDTPDDPHYGSVTLCSYNTLGSHFKIHFTKDVSSIHRVPSLSTTTDPNVYGDCSTIPDFAIELGIALETSYSYFTTTLGFLDLPPDKGDISHGGDGSVDVYIVKMSAAGFATTDSDDSNGPGYLAITNDLSSASNLSSSPQKGLLQVTASHELFHLFQLQKNLNADTWWIEATATWAEDQVYSGVDDYLGYLGNPYVDANDNGIWDSGETYYEYTYTGTTTIGTTRRPSKWFDYPELSIESFGPTAFKGYQYGTVIFAKYLSEKYDVVFIKNTWDKIGQNNSTLDSISLELISRGTTFIDAIIDFRTKIRRQDFFVDKDYYPLVYHEDYGSGNWLQINTTLNPRGARYYYYKATSTATNNALKIDIQNMNTGTVKARVILFKSTTNNCLNNNCDEQDIIIDSDNTTKTISNFGINDIYKKAVVVVADTATGTSSTSTITSASSNKSCFIATAVYGSYFDNNVKILRDFRDGYLIGNPMGRLFVKFYYIYSPHIANLISKSDILRTGVRYILNPIVYVIKYPSTLILLVVYLIVLRARKKK